MTIVRGIKKLFWFSVVLITIMSSTLLLMPISFDDPELERIVTIAIGLIFWISTISGYGLLFYANKKRKELLINKIGVDPKMNCRNGLLTFFSNSPAIMADITLIASGLLFIALNFTDYRYSYIAYVLLFILILSLNLHCLFNGRIYKVSNLKNIRRKDL